MLWTTKAQQQEIFFEIIDNLYTRMSNNLSVESFFGSMNAQEQKALESVMDPCQKQKLNEILHTQSTDLIKMPTNSKDANKVLLKGKQSMFANLPVPDIKIIAGHAVGALDQLLDQIVAQGVAIKWLQDKKVPKST